MSEEQIPETRSRAARYRDHASKALLGQFTVPGWLLIIIAIVIGVPDWNSRYEFWLGVAKSSGGHMSILADVLLWKYFPPALALTGVAYLLFVGNPRLAPKSHPFVSVVAWIALSCCLIAVVVTAGYGAMEFYIRDQIAKGVAGVPRNTPDAANPNRPQAPLYVSNWAVLQPDQIRLLLQELPKLKEKSPTVWFASVSMDNDGYSYWRQFDQIFKRSGLNAPRIDQIPRGPEEQGLMLEVRDLNNLSESAQKLREAFQIANIPLKLILLPNGVVNPDVDFVVFIGPRPIH